MSQGHPVLHSLSELGTAKAGDKINFKENVRITNAYRRHRRRPSLLLLHANMKENMSEENPSIGWEEYYEMRGWGSWATPAFKDK